MAVGLFAIACGSSAERPSDFASMPIPAADASVPAADGSASPVLEVRDGGGVGAEDALTACASEIRKAEPMPVDLYVMLDTSGSMDWATQAGESKWVAVKRALGAFLNDPRSAGIGVGLQYFPLAHPGVPAECATSAACGVYGPCATHVCSAGPLRACDNALDCAGHGGACVRLGDCLNGALCFPDVAGGASDCGPGNGTCTALATAYCEKQYSCDVADYATPAVPIATLPGAAASLEASLAARAPVGGTPTASALSGAVTFAKRVAAGDATRAVAAVLVTDGFPTQCGARDIGGIAQIAADALAGAPGVRTFVLGVFTPSEEGAARTNLDRIASAGGSGKAFVVTTAGDVAEGLRAALDAVRLDAVPCAYPVPVPVSGVPDYTRVNVRRVAVGGSATSVAYVARAASCDAVRGGWYYDADPSSGATPTTLSLCPASCAATKTTPSEQVEVVLGCRTELK